MPIISGLISGAQSIIYSEIYNVLSKLGTIISLKELGKGYIGIKEDYINLRLQKACGNSSGIKSLHVSCSKDKGSFILEFKKFFVKGTVEIPFQITFFKFNSVVKEVTFKIEKEKRSGNDYYSRLFLWFILTVIGAFNTKNDLLDYVISDNSYLRKEQDGQYTVDLCAIPELKDTFQRFHWKRIRFDGLRIDNNIVFLHLHKEFAEKITSASRHVKERGDKIIGKLGAVVTEKFKR